MQERAARAVADEVEDLYRRRHDLTAEEQLTLKEHEARIREGKERPCYPPGLTVIPMKKTGLFGRSQSKMRPASVASSAAESESDVDEMQTGAPEL